MKKQEILYAILILFIFNLRTSIKAQNETRSTYGIITGLNISNLYTKDANHTDMIAGFNAGMFYRLPITDLFSIEPELYYTSKGATLTYNNLYLNGTANFNLNYLEMPVLCIVNFTPMFNLQIGPYLAYLFDTKITNIANIQLYDYERKLSINNMNRFDCGIIIGSGLDLGRIRTGIRYSLGLTKVAKPSPILEMPYKVPNSINGVINLYLTISLNNMKQ